MCSNIDILALPERDWFGNSAELFRIAGSIVKIAVNINIRNRVALPVEKRQEFVKLNKP